MTDKTYNGWTNYETWAVGLWLDNDQASYSYWNDQALEHSQAAATCRQVKERIWTPSEAAKFNLADQLKEAIHDASPLSDATVYTDLLNAALSEVNWQEIAEHYLEGIPEPSRENKHG